MGNIRRHCAVFMYFTLAAPFFKFFTRARRGVTLSISDVNGTQHEPLQRRFVHLPNASSTLSSHADSSSGAVTRSARLPGRRLRRPSPVTRCSSVGPARPRWLEPKSTPTSHLLYAESVFRALSAPVANQIGAVASVQKLHLCLGSLHWPCKPGQGETRLLHFIT